MSTFEEELELACRRYATVCPRDRLAATYDFVSMLEGYDPSWWRALMRLRKCGEMSGKPRKGSSDALADALSSLAATLDGDSAEREAVDGRAEITEGPPPGYSLSQRRAFSEGQRMRWNNRPRSWCRFKAPALVEAWQCGWDGRAAPDSVRVAVTLVGPSGDVVIQTSVGVDADLFASLGGDSDACQEVASHWLRGHSVRGKAVEGKS